MRVSFVLLTSIVLLISGCAKNTKVYPINHIATLDDNSTKQDRDDIKKIELTQKTTPSQPIPLKGADKIVRVLILPYVDSDNVLRSQSFSFAKIDEGKWVIGSYLLQRESSDFGRTLTPLE